MFYKPVGQELFVPKIVEYEDFTSTFILKIMDKKH